MYMLTLRNGTKVTFDQSKPCQVGPEVHKKDETEFYLLNGLHIIQNKTKESIKMLIQTIQFIFISIFYRCEFDRLGAWSKCKVQSRDKRSMKRIDFPE